MFAPNVVGTANATAAGWGSLGGGVTQIFYDVSTFQSYGGLRIGAECLWPVSMVVPAVMFVVCAIA